MPVNVGRGSIVTIANLTDVIAMTSAACDVLETMGDRILMLPATANNGHGPEYNSIVAALDISANFAQQFETTRAEHPG